MDDCRKGFVVEAWKPQLTSSRKKEKGKPQMKKCFFVAGVSAFVVTAASSADMTGAWWEGRQVSATDFAGQPDFNGYVIDLWMESDDATDKLLNTFNTNINNDQNNADYYQSFTGTGWTPNNLGPPFETEALKHADSFVSAGGRKADTSSAYVDGVVVQMAANGTGLDPNFGGNNAGVPGADAGWYNSDPANYIGEPVSGFGSGPGGELRIFVGRFALQGVERFEIFGNVNVTWNNGIGTEGFQEDFEIMEVPAPGAVALLGLAGLASRRRRR